MMSPFGWLTIFIPCKTGLYSSRGMRAHRTRIGGSDGNKLNRNQLDNSLVPSSCCNYITNCVNIYAVINLNWVHIGSKSRSQYHLWCSSRETHIMTTRARRFISWILMCTIQHCKLDKCSRITRYPVQNNWGMHRPFMGAVQYECTPRSTNHTSLETNQPNWSHFNWHLMPRRVQVYIPASLQMQQFLQPSAYSCPDGLQFCHPKNACLCLFGEKFHLTSSSVSASSRTASWHL